MIQLVSYRSGLGRSKRIECTIDILNSAAEPFVMFSGHTLFEQEDVFSVESGLTNKHVTALLEVRHVKSSSFLNNEHCLFLVRNGEVHNMFSQQLFATSKEIKNNADLAERLLLELEQRRKIEVEGKRCLILQCGENNILTNIQSEHNRAVFRFSDNMVLSKRFQTLLEDTDIILNPMHTPMGNQGKMQKRREYLSADNRYYFSCSNTRSRDRQRQMREGSLQHKLQYAYRNSLPILPYDNKITKDCRVQYF